MLYIGVDLGGTGIKAGVVNERGEILSKGSTPTMKERPYQAIIRDIAALCEDVAKQANVAMADIAAIGVGVPGICDPKTGIIPFCTNLGWHEVPFVAEMGKYLPNRVVVDNDATVAGYAESIAGVSKGTKSSVFITLGTGVGGGIVINGNDLIDAQKWYQTVANGDTTPQYYTYSATNFRLQELSLGYTLPRKWFRNKMGLTVSFVGRNLWMIYCKAPFDPEAVASTGLSYQGIDYFMMPSLRSLGFNVKFEF